MSDTINAAKNGVNELFRGKEAWQIARDTLLAAAAAWGMVKLGLAIRRRGARKVLLGALLSAVNSTAAGRAAIAKDQEKTIAKLRAAMHNKDARPDEVQTMIPAKGRSEEQLLATLTRWAQCERAHWSEGQVSGGIYHGGDDLNAFLTKVYGMFSLTNPLHADVFPFTRQMEAEVVRMTINLFRGDQRACGTMTSGGTESILMAMKAYRDAAREKGIEVPEIVAGVSAHAAFDKAAHYFGMKLVSLPVDPVSMRVDPAAVRRAITRNTCVLVASAPGFPHGVIDPIEELAALAQERGLGLHVDACLGGYLLPFARQLGHPLPPFDFSVAGVTSISADTHKYGYAPKGSSVVMYRDPQLRHYQYFVAPQWSGGVYASPSMPGSRPGGLIAATWAALVRMGQDGYLSCAKEILATATAIAEGVQKIPGLKLVGKPDLSVVAFTADESVKVNGNVVNIFKVGESMTKSRTRADGTTRPGWCLNTLQKPGALHICVTYMHRGLAPAFLSDLADAVQEVTANPNLYRDGTAAIYGMAEALPDGTLIEEMAKGFIDTLFMTEDQQ